MYVFDYEKIKNELIEKKYKKDAILRSSSSHLVNVSFPTRDPRAYGNDRKESVLFITKQLNQFLNRNYKVNGTKTNWQQIRQLYIEFEQEITKECDAFESKWRTNWDPAIQAIRDQFQSYLESIGFTAKTNWKQKERIKTQFLFDENQLLVGAQKYVYSETLFDAEFNGYYLNQMIPTIRMEFRSPNEIDWRTENLQVFQGKINAPSGSINEHVKYTIENKHMNEYDQPNQAIQLLGVGYADLWSQFPVFHEEFAAIQRMLQQIQSEEMEKRGLVWPGY